MSDVALRKICVKLGVPVPPLGYWAKIVAGRTPPMAKLPSSHKVPTRHVRQVREDPEAPERERRITALLESDPVPALSPPVLKTSVAETHVAIRRTAKALKKREYYGRGLLHADAEDVFVMSVSAANRDRAIHILDAIIATALNVGAKIEPSAKTKRPLIALRGESFELAIHEPARRTGRALTPLEIRQQRRGELTWIRERFIFVSTGKMRLEIRAEGAYSPLLTITDGRELIETRLEIVLPTLMQKAAELTIERQMREEEKERERIAQKKTRKHHRRSQYGTRASRADREEGRELAPCRKSTSLRRALPSAAGAEAVWIRNAADWLDPIVDKHWPEVDV